MKEKYAFITDIGLRRANNEDNAGYTSNEYGDFIGVVCDGMGGHQGGEIASSLVVDAILRSFDKAKFKDFNTDQTIKWISQLIHETNDVLKAKSEVDSVLDAMGTTVVIAAQINGEIYFANSGDSRGYYYKRGKLSKITNDHNLAARLVEDGELSLKDSFNHPSQNMLYSSLGPMKEVKIDMYRVAKQKGIILLTTDGVHGQITDSVIAKVISKNRSLKNAAQEMINLSNEAGGKDNATALLIRV